ncbi:hypothetical protein B0H16DRAFT_1703875 [Mycena metata]|uniref:Uncharacterized protein n=1 Tax=Mycena metata TaxID=1033252 RepID=A0AAD7MBG8_9AGAR|nr:hypothetical protein B0H16DRAFT_1703875 [Mycena metata]
MGWIEGSSSAVRDLDSNLIRFLTSLSTIPPPHVSTTVGIIGVHVCAISLRAAFILVSGLPFATKTILRELARPRVLSRFICCFLGQTIFTGLVFKASAAWGQQQLLLQGYVLDWLRFKVADWLKSLPSSDQPPGAPPWSDSELFLCHYRHWKSTQIKDFHVLAPGFRSKILATFKALLGIWYQLPLAQKLLIAAPAVIFYGYRYLMPKARLMSRRVQALIRIWCR